MTLYDNEENAVVNNANKESETPSNLVGDVQDFDPEGLNSEDKFNDKLWPKVVMQGEGWWDGDMISVKDIGRINGELTPNPAKFGFRKQEIVDSLPGSGLPDHLYLLKVKNDDVLIGYRPYKWVLVEGVWGWHRANLVTPDLDLKKGEHEIPVKVTNPEKKMFAQIFNGNVAINNGKLYINGKEAGQGGGGDTRNHPNIYEVESFENVPAEILEQLNVGDIVAQVFNGGAIKKLGFVNQITNHLEILHLDGDIFNFYEYHKVDNEWSLDEHYQQVSQRVYTAYLSDIARLTYDELDVLNLGDVVRTDTETWVVSNFSEEDEDFAIYLCKTTDKSIVFVRYVYNEDDDEYTFDTSYGVDGYNVISLSGGGGGGSDNTIWLNIPYNMDIRDSVGEPTEVVIHDNTTLNELAKLLPLLTDPEKNVKVIWAGEIVSGSVGCEVFSDPNEGSYITLAFAEWAGPGTTITFNITIEDNAISQVTAKASRDDGIEIIYDLTKTYIVNNVADNYVPPETIVVNVPANFSQDYNISQPMVYNRNRTLHEPDPVDSNYDIIYWLYSNSFVDLDNDTLVYSEVCIIIKERTDEISYSFNSQGYALTII